MRYENEVDVQEEEEAQGGAATTNGVNQMLLELRLESTRKLFWLECDLRAGSFPGLVEFLARPQLQIEAACAWTKFKTGTLGDNRVALIKHGAVPSLAQTLISGSASVSEQVEAACARTNFTSGLTLIKQVAVPLPLQILSSGSAKAHDQVKLVLAAVHHPSHSTEALTDAWWALSYIANGSIDSNEAVNKVGEALFPGNAECGVLVSEAPVTLSSLDVDRRLEEHVLSAIHKVMKSLPDYICRLCRAFISKAQHMQLLEPSDELYRLYPGVEGLFLCSDPSISERLSEVEVAERDIIFYNDFCWEQKSLTCNSCVSANHIVGKKVSPLVLVDPNEPFLGFRRTGAADPGLTLVFATEVELSN